MSIENNDEKTKLEVRKNRVQHILGILSLVHIIALLVGALLGFFYLVRHQFNPGGISGSDMPAMILWALGFPVTLTIGLGLATMASFPLLSSSILLTNFVAVDCFGLSVKTIFQNLNSGGNSDSVGQTGSNGAVIKE